MTAGNEDSAATASRARSNAKALCLLVPFPPGGSTDFTARVLARELAGVQGTPVTVETHAGERGIAAVRRLMLGPADSVFLVGNINANSMLPVVQPALFDFDYRSALRPVTRLAEFPSVIMTQADCPEETLGDFLRRLARTGGRLRYGTDFLGTYVDYDALMLARAAGLAVAYRNANGALEILRDLRNASIDIAMLNVATATANRGAYKPLAVTGATRLANFPDVPTLEEAGFAGIGTSNWQGLFASGAADDATVAALHGSVVAAFAGEGAERAFAAVDARVAVSPSPQDFARELDAEMARWREVAPAILALPAAEADSRV